MMFIKKFMNGRNIAPKKIIQITAGRRLIHEY